MFPSLSAVEEEMDLLFRNVLMSLGKQAITVCIHSVSGSLKKIIVIIKKKKKS